MKDPVAQKKCFAEEYHMIQNTLYIKLIGIEHIMDKQDIYFRTKRYCPRGITLLKDYNLMRKRPILLYCVKCQKSNINAKQVEDTLNIRYINYYIESFLIKKCDNSRLPCFLLNKYSYIIPDFEVTILSTNPNG